MLGRIQYICNKYKYMYFQINEMLLLPEGEVYSWGNNARGRLGRTSGTSTTEPHKVTMTSEELFSVVSISCNHVNTLVATRRKFK